MKLESKEIVWVMHAMQRPNHNPCVMSIL